MKRFFLFLCLACVLAAVAATDTTGDQDVANRWYQQLPAVSRATVQARVECLSAALAEDGLQVKGWTLRSEAAGPQMPGESGLAPAVITWQIDQWTWESDAALTSLFPQVAYVEIMRAWGRKARRNTPRCPDPNAPALAPAPSPIGKRVECPPELTGPCHEGSGGTPQQWTDAGGVRWKQVWTGRMFWRTYWWVRE